jgi:uncharacterized protein YwqG
MDFHIDLPSELLPYQEQLLKSRRPYIKILPHTGVPQGRWQSKIGGLPYLPEGMAYPLASDGSPLVLLIQVNFAEIPPLTPFPEDGLLQIFIHDDGFYGLDLDAPFNQSNFRVRYIPLHEIDESAAPLDFGILKDCNYEQLPFNPQQVYALDFELSQELPQPQGSPFEQLMGPDFFGRFGARKWEVLDAYSQAVQSGKHKIGGFAQFAQEDPRSPGSPMELLLQLGSDSSIGCMWGDMGVANFFICPLDLARRDFSNVMYNWDCY